MQTTLLGVAVVIILALVAALVGPLFIDWSRHRSEFEAQAASTTPLGRAGTVDEIAAAVAEEAGTTVPVEVVQKLADELDGFNSGSAAPRDLHMSTPRVATRNQR
jgi:hypothetical protein